MSPTPASLQRTLRWSLLILLVAAGAAILQSSLWLFDQALRRIYLDDLMQESAGLLLALPPPGDAQLDPARIHPRYERAYSGWYYRIERPGQSWRSRSLWDTTLDWPAAPGTAPALMAGPDGQRLLVYRADYRRRGQPVVVSVARDYTPALAAFRRVQLGGAAVVLLALAAALLAQYLVVRRALRPLERARGEIAQLRQGSRQRLDEAVPVELAPLVAEINRLLAATEETLRRSRGALGNLGHALKTPLAVLTALVDRPELAAAPALQAQLREQLALIGQRIGRELGRARLAGEALPAARFDCAAELPELCRTLAMIHPDKAVEWTAPPGCQLPWDREDMLELLGNLLDNGAKWARSRVWLRVERRPQGWLLRVDDDGPGIPAAERERVVGRGVRLDESQAGHGLGLGIVADIVTAWCGSWRLESAPAGGLRVEIELPASPVSDSRRGRPD